MSRIVLPVGPRTAEIAVVGEAPGAEEEKAGVPFVGASGRLLDAFLAKAGIRRTSIWITNVYKVRPPGNKLSNISYDVLALSMEDLRDELLSLPDLKVVICLGGYAMKALTTWDKITLYRGSVTTFLYKFFVIPTYHPAYLIRGNMKLHTTVIADLRKAKKLLNEDPKQWIEPSQNISLRICDTLEKVINMVDDILTNYDRFSFDIETLKKEKRITCIGFGLPGHKAYLVPLKQGTYKNVFSETNEILVWQELKKLFLSTSHVKIAQNMGFDITYIAPLLGTYPLPPLFDTLLAHHTLQLELPHTLAFLASVYTNFQYFKSDFKEWKSSSLPHDEQLWQYNSKDCVSTLIIAEELQKDLISAGLFEFFSSYVMPLEYLLIQISNFGLLTNEEERKKLSGNLKKLEEQVCEDLKVLAGREINPNSSKQVCEYLYKERKCNKIYKRGTRNLTADEEALNRLFRKYQFPEIKLILQAREAKKLRSTFVDVKKDPDGRVRTRYSASGTVTGRLSSKQTIFKRGVNYQNIPGPLRKIYIPDPGHGFLDADLKAADSRIVAWLSDCTPLIEAYLAGKDVHRLVASFLFTKSEEEITKDERQLAKKVHHGCNYGLGKRLLATAVGCAVREAEDFICKYFALFPQIREWQNLTRKQLHKNRTLITPLGRRRTFNDFFGPEMYKQAYAYVPQSTVADYLNIGILKITSLLFPKCRVVNQLHDSFTLMYPLSTNVSELKSLIHKELEFPMIISNKECKIPYEIKDSADRGWGVEE